MKPRHDGIGEAMASGWVVLCLSVAVAPCPSQDTQQRAKEPAVIRGRCVDAETNKPLAGCKVTLTGWPFTATPDQVKREGWQAPRPFITLADGKFEVKFDAVAGYLHRLQITHELRAPRRETWKSFRPGQVEVLQDVQMIPGLKVHGQVLDDAGKPLARTAVVYRDLPLLIGLDAKKLGLPIPNVNLRGVQASAAGNVVWDRSAAVLKATTDAEGRFEFSHCVPCVDPTALEVQATGSTTAPHARHANDKVVVDVRVVRCPSISGRVVDQHGRGIAGVRLMAHKGYGVAVSTRTLADGSFHLVQDRQDPGAPVGKDVPIYLVVKDSGLYEPVGEEPITRWGAKDLVLQMRPATCFTTQVVEAGSQKPLEHFTLACRVFPAFPRSYEPRLFPGPHRGGRVQVDGVRRGWNRLVVIPQAPKLEVVSVAFEATGDKFGPTRIEVRRLVPMKVRVLDADGKPAAGLLVRVAQFNALGAIRNLALMDFHGGNLGAFGGKRRAPTLVSRAQTNTDGACVVYGIPRQTNQGLYVSSTEAFLHMEPAVMFGTAKKELEIELEKRGK